MAAIGQPWAGRYLRPGSGSPSPVWGTLASLSSRGGAALGTVSRPCLAEPPRDHRPPRGIRGGGRKRLLEQRPGAGIDASRGLGQRLRRRGGEGGVEADFQRCAPRGGGGRHV